MYSNQFFRCPYYTPKINNPFINTQMKNIDDADDLGFNYRAPEQEVNRILSLLNSQLPQLVMELERYGVNRMQVEAYFRTTISYILDNISNYQGNITQRVSAIFNDFKKQYDSIFNFLRTIGIPDDVVNNIFKAVIEFTLRHIAAALASTPVPGSRWG